MATVVIVYTLQLMRTPSAMSDSTDEGIPVKISIEGPVEEEIKEDNQPQRQDDPVGGEGESVVSGGEGGGGGDAPVEGEAGESQPDGDPSSGPAEAEATTTAAAGDGGEEGGGVETTGDGGAGEGEEREGTDKDAPTEEGVEDVSQEKKIEDGAEGEQEEQPPGEEQNQDEAATTAPTEDSQPTKPEDTTTTSKSEPSTGDSDSQAPDGDPNSADIKGPEVNVLTIASPGEDLASAPMRGEVVNIDGIPILQDIKEEEEQEVEAEEGEGDRIVKQELIEKIVEAYEERNRMQELNERVQSTIAEYLATKKDDEKAEPGRTVIDHEKKYLQCMTMLEHLHEEIDLMKSRNEEETEKLIEQRDLKLDQVAKAKAEFGKYRKEKVLNVVDQRTGRKFTAKELQMYEDAEDKKEKSIIEIRLECIKLQNKIAKLENSIKQKEQLVGGLHLIDFEQLKINNVDLNEKIEERNDEILKLKKKVTSTVEVLTHVKEKLQFLQVENAQKKEALREIEAVVAKKRDHLTRIKRTRDTLRADNMRLRQKGGLVGHTSLLRDFEERLDESKAMYERLETLQKRQAELTVMCDGLRKKIEQAKSVGSNRT